MKIAFMFSGQGAQYTGMCQELYDNYDVVKNIFNKANSILKYDVKDILFNNAEKLNNTLYTQPLMFVMYASILAVLKEKGIESTDTLGLSLGEFGALYDSGILDFESTLLLLQKRGMFMAKACEQTDGKMAAILGMDADDLEKIIAHTEGYVKIANYNTYGQLVISGSKDSVKKICENALQQGAKRAIELQTSGAFHSDYMETAKTLMEEYIKTVHFNEPTKRLLVNTTGDYYVGSIQNEITSQITNSVMFYQMIETLLQDGCTTFIEIGPKKTLCSFVKKVNRKVTILNVEDIPSLEKTLQKLEDLQ